MPFDVSVNHARNTVLVSFRGDLTREDFSALDELARQFAGQRQYDVVFDMTEVAQVDVTADFVAARGSLPQAFPGRERIYVVPEKSLKALAAVYACYQAAESRAVGDRHDQGRRA